MTSTLQYFQQGLWLAVITSAPPLIIATLAGCLVSILQAITQIQDQTLPYFIKLTAVSISLLVMGRWIGSELIQLMELALSMVASVGQ